MKARPHSCFISSLIYENEIKLEEVMLTQPLDAKLRIKKRYAGHNLVKNTQTIQSKGRDELHNFDPEVSGSKSVA